MPMHIPPEKVPAIERYIVTGSLPFPIDMLRYDRAWPASESDSHVIEQTVRHENTTRVEVTVCARKPPTVGRWNSFGWTVLKCLRADEEPRYG